MSKPYKMIHIHKQKLKNRTKRYHTLHIIHNLQFAMWSSNTSSLTKKPTQPCPQHYTPAPAHDYSAVGREEPRTPHNQTARTKKGQKVTLENGTSKPAELATP